ncbi:hypothetical protein ACFY8K_32925 [Streptomyces misionensis]|uniref:hypothetical protein n=1 Tax=Streptomyces misionensis TaxID=67331 RepID=UPI0036B71B24
MEDLESPAPRAGAAEAETEAGEADRPAAPVRRRGRTAGLIAGAAAFGIVAGACAGYVVQAGRPPTGLPSLSQPVLRQGKGDVPLLTAAEDRQVKTDGDLRELLLPKPRGARDDGTGDDGWMDLVEYATYSEHPGATFRYSLQSQFRRAAVTGWETGATYAVEIRLVQYHQDQEAGAREHVKDQEAWVGSKQDTGSWPVPGAGDGMAYVHDRPRTRPGYLPMYEAEAYASRGDIVMEMWITDSKPVSKEKIMDLAKRQVGRL